MTQKKVKNSYSFGKSKRDYFSNLNKEDKQYNLGPGYYNVEYNDFKFKDF